ncbi:MAG: transposase [Acidobacteria bacterium]|nr:transposase [Acidobacteriota bacterium]
MGWAGAVPGTTRGGCWWMWRWRSPTGRRRSATCRPWPISRICTVASTATMWRVLDGVDAEVLGRLRTARATARERAWAARAELTGTELPPARAAGRDLGYAVIDIGAPLVTAHSDKQGTAGNFKGGFGYHPIGAWLDNTGEALAAILRP